YGSKHLVSTTVTECIVDALEVIDVQHRYPKCMLVAYGLTLFDVGATCEFAAIDEPREWINRRQLSQGALFFEEFELTLRTRQELLEKERLDYDVVRPAIECTHQFATTVGRRRRDHPRVQTQWTGAQLLDNALAT